MPAAKKQLQLVEKAPDSLLPAPAKTRSISPHQFREKWGRACNLTERAASQSHFNDICGLVGYPTPVEADPEGKEFTFEKGASKIDGSGGWADVWKKGCFAWEYKGRHKNLGAALTQLQQYAIALDNPPLLVVSDIEKIIIHTNFNNSIHVSHLVRLEDLENQDTLQKLEWLFTDPEKLRPITTTESVTRQAAKAFAAISQKLRDQGYDGHRVAHFMTKVLFCMFAEDIQLLPKKVFTLLLESVEKYPSRFPDKARELFVAMQRGGPYGYMDIPWFNGGLFDNVDVLPLSADLLRETLKAARLDWSQIEPSIFGTLFERGLDPSKRSQIGAHYTDPVSIKRIIDPVVIEPLKEEWQTVKREIHELIQKKGRLTSPRKRKDPRIEAETKYKAFLARLSGFRVLDAACGSGNFLYLALVALKDLEHQVKLEGETYGFQRSFYEVGPQNVIGIELNDYAAELARVTIWIGEIQWMLRHGFGAPCDPVLKRLDHIENRDALLNPDGSEAKWPSANCIIGNPPFLGDKKMISELGETYVTHLRTTYKGRVPGGADLVTYWFEKARAEIEAGQAQAAGLVATNSIRGGVSRKVLSRICASGRIYNGWSDEPWINEGAAVRVSLVCFDDGQQGTISLNGQAVTEIFADLTGQGANGEGVNLTTASSLSENHNVCFEGIKKYGPFDVPGDLARKWLTISGNPNSRPNSEVLGIWLNSQDLVRRPSDTWVIDFGNLDEYEAAQFEGPFDYVTEHVKPARANDRNEKTRTAWWRYERPRREMREAVLPLSRFIVTPIVAKHRVFVWVPSEVLTSNLLDVIARDDDTTFGILHSRFHELWALRMCTWLGAGNDPRYTPTTTFETFPFPDGLTPNIPAERYASDPRAKRIAKAAQRLVELRDNWLNPPSWVRRVPEVVPGYPDRLVAVDPAAERELKKRTLTNLYNQKPQWLINAQQELGAAVAAAYGWRPDIDDQEVLKRLLALNRKRATAAIVRPKKKVQAAGEGGGKKTHFQLPLMLPMPGGKKGK